MTEYNAGDRVLVPGVVEQHDGDSAFGVRIPTGGRVWLGTDDLRPDTGGRDLSAGDVLEAINETDVFADGHRPVAGRLNRIARGDAGSAGDDTAPDAESIRDWLDGLAEAGRAAGEAIGARFAAMTAAAPRPSGAGDDTAPREVRHGVGEGFPRVAGRCPACRGASLFLAAGEHVTCSRLDCPDPCAADDYLGRSVEQIIAAAGAGDDTAPPAEGPDRAETLAVLDRLQRGVDSSDGWHLVWAAHDIVDRVRLIHAAAGPRAGDTAPDERACPVCNYLDSVRVSLGDEHLPDDLLAGAVARLRSDAAALRAERDALRRDLDLIHDAERRRSDRLAVELAAARSDAAALRAAGDALADAKNWVGHVVMAERWRSAAGSPTTDEEKGAQS